MIKEILFLSVDQMKRIKPSLDTVVVSILDASERAHRPRLAGFKSVLCLEFEDTYEEIKLAGEGAWPDEPTDVEHARFAQGRGERIPTLTDARAIVEFVQRHQECPEEVTLIAHCFGGISRSAAVAVWTSVRYWIPIANANMRSTDGANKRLMRLMDKAAGRR